MTATSNTTSQLAGFTVVDLSRYLPGPYCTRLLADMGATVTKVEAPRGDPMRGIAWYDLLNHGKQIVALDLRDSEGRAVLGELLSSADVCVESFRPSTARALGVDGATLVGRYPRLVHCSIGGYPGSGPAVERSGHDVNYQADAGLLAAGPRVPSLPIADITGGLRAAVSIAAALVQRERTNHGTMLQLSLYDAALAWAPFLAPPKLRGDYACYNLYRTADGSRVALGALEPKFWERFCCGAGREDWIGEQFAEAAQARLVDEVAALFRSRDAAHWADALLPLDCCFSIVREPAGHRLAREHHGEGPERAL